MGSGGGGKHRQIGGQGWVAVRLLGGDRNLGAHGGRRRLARPTKACELVFVQVKFVTFVSHFVSSSP